MCPAGVDRTLSVMAMRERDKPSAKAVYAQQYCSRY